MDDHPTAGAAGARTYLDHPTALFSKFVCSQRAPHDWQMTDTLKEIRVAHHLRVHSHFITVFVRDGRRELESWREVCEARHFGVAAGDGGRARGSGGHVGEFGCGC